MNNIDMNSKKEKFYMAVFMVSYIGIYVCIFFWQMFAVSLLCKRTGFAFPKAVIALTVINLIFFYFRTRFITVIDGIVAAGVVAAGFSSAFMGDRSGLWVTQPKFLIDLGILTVSFFLMMASVMIHEARVLRENDFFADDEPDGGDIADELAELIEKIASGEEGGEGEKNEETPRSEGDTRRDDSSSDDGGKDL